MSAERDGDGEGERRDITDCGSRTEVDRVPGVLYYAIASVQVILDVRLLLLLVDELEVDFVLLGIDLGHGAAHRAGRPAQNCALGDDSLDSSLVLDNDAELSAPEFVQFVGRVADVRVPADRRGATPFEETLDAWLGLQLVPACRKAVQARGGRWHTEA